MKKSTPQKKEQTIRVMKRKTTDNKYLHKDFHIALNHLMNYIYDNFGEDSVREYLEQYANTFFKPLKDRLKTGDIKALEDYLRDICQKEEWKINMTVGKNFIETEQNACPGISHLVSKGIEPCPLYRETYLTIYKTLCENTPFEYTLSDFNESTGACKQKFVRKEDAV